MRRIGLDDDSDTDSDESVHKISVMSVGDKTTLMRVMVDESETLWQPDTGAKRNLMDVTHWEDFNRKHGGKVTLQKTKTRLFPYGEDEKPLSVLGKFRATFRAGKNEVVDTIYVTQERNEHPLISEDTSLQLQLVSYNKRFVVNSIKPDSGRNVASEIRQEFPELFTGLIGKFNNHQVEIMTKENVVPIAQKPRKMPIHLMDKAEAKVKQLFDQDVIERFPDNEPRTWINPNVVAKKPNGDIRFCQDMRLANNAIDRPYTTTPTLEEIKAKFAGAERFSKIDLKEAYNQFELSPESRNITTFYGPDGLYRYKRLNYGTKSSQDIMQIELQRILADIPSQLNMADDILFNKKNGCY